MNDGRIVQEGDPAEIYERPRSVFASHFIGEANLLRGTVTDATHVRIGNVEVQAPATDVDAGSDVVVSVRPERIVLGPQARGLANSFDGRIAERWAVRDDLGTLIQLGALTPRSPAPVRT